MINETFCSTEHAEPDCGFINVYQRKSTGEYWCGETTVVRASGWIWTGSHSLYPNRLVYRIRVRLKTTKTT